MSNQLTTTQPNQFALSREMDNNTWNAIKEIYDGASDEKVALVIDYCKARKLDPLKKPVHIVPVWSNRRKCMVETLWPSVSEVRITAMRTGAFVRQDATAFGPDITRKVGNVEITFPEFAMVTVYRLVGGESQPFHGPKVRWMETYSNKGRDDASPNAMWLKRPYGQLEKCAEAAALRRAFPEEGSYTAEEMHGKELDEHEEIPGTENVTPAASRPEPRPRATRGAAGAKNTEVVVTQDEQKASEQKPADAAPVQDIQQAMQAREAKTVVNSAATAAPAPTPATASPATSTPANAAPSNPAPAATPPVVSRAFLTEGERYVTTAKVDDFKAIAANVEGQNVAAIRAILSGGYVGEVRQKEGGAKFVNNNTEVVALPPWQVGAVLKFTLFGKKASNGKVIPWVEKIETVGSEPENLD